MAFFAFRTIPYAILATLVGGMFGPLPAQAQGTADPIAFAVQQCAEGDTLSRCPNYCQVACTSTQFLLDNTDACDTAMAALPDADEASCPIAAETGIVTLQACIDENRKVPREPSRVIARSQERLEIFNAFFSDRPSCAASSLALEGMFGCLSGETAVVKREYDALGTLGLGEAPLTGAQLLELACSIGEDRLIEIDIGASSLSGRAKELNTELGGVTSCRLQYSNWFADRGQEFCTNRTFDNCEAVVTVFQTQLEKSLVGAEEQNRQISDVVENLERDLASLISLGFVDPSTCD
ncbi:hypothetical protein [Antarctobacter jejuensis]|uniref:hypothetical protein n=1 Tax=Antarctobacter jejuensis TaxID=1439938 RepID=UPI003FD06F14